MRLGLGSYAYAWAVGIPGYPPPATPMTALRLLERAAELGLHLVQIADNLPLDHLSDVERGALRARAVTLGVAVEVGTRGIAPEHLRHYLAIAREFGSPILRIVVDSANHHPAVEEIIATLRAILPEFEQAGITLAIENHDRFSVETLRSIIQQAGSHALGICLDTVNSFGAGEGPGVVVPLLGPYVVNLHVKDYTIRRHHHNLGFEIEGTPAGAGALAIPALLESLARLNVTGRDFNAILELWPPPESTTEATIAKEDAWVVQSVAYLRQYIHE